MLKRSVILLVNLFFPPVGVCLLCGLGADVFLNCILFLLAIIPSHVHAFYISCTYFSRKSKVRKGIYPGKWKRMIYSERIQNGGASNREVENLKLGRQRYPNTLEKLSSNRMSRQSSKRRSGEMTPVQTSPTSPHYNRRSVRHSQLYESDLPSRRSSRSRRVAN